MKRILILALTLGVAPFQCPSKPNPMEVREDSPGEALYKLSRDFAGAGSKDAQIRTLKYIAEQYPRSRFAVQARSDLKDLGAPLPDPSIHPDPTQEGVPLGRLPTDPGYSAAPSAPPSGASAAPSVAR